MIISNSAHEPGHVLEAQGLPPTVTASNTGCWRYKGTASYKGNIQLDMILASLHKSGETFATDVILQREPLSVETHWTGAQYLGVSRFTPLTSAVTTAWSGEGTCLESGTGTYRKVGAGVVEGADGALEVVAHSVGSEDHRGYAGDASSQSPVPVVGAGCMKDIFSGVESVGEWLHIHSLWQRRVGPGGTLSGTHTNETPSLGTITAGWSFQPVVE